MSDEKRAKLELPPVEAAQDTLNQLYVERFFSKMAEYGFQPQTQEGAAAMLQTAVELDAVPELETKSASQSDPFVEAYSRLQKHAQAQGHGAASREKSAEIERRNWAYACARSPEIYGAVLSLKAAEAAASN